MNVRTEYILRKWQALLSVFFVFTLSSVSFSQQFIQVDSTSYIDEVRFEEWESRYEFISNEDTTRVHVPYLSVREAWQTKVGFRWKKIAPASRKKITFFIDTLQIKPIEHTLSADTAIFNLPPREDDYSIVARNSKGKIIAKINVQVYWYHDVDVVIVPLLETNLIEKDLSAYLNTVFAQAQLGMHVTIDPVYKHDEIDPEKPFVNPSYDFDRYTDQMQQLREYYFEDNPKTNNSTYYVFVVPGFVNEQIEGYHVVNKAMSFVKDLKSDTTRMYRTIAQQLGASVGALNYTWINEGPQKGTTGNLMDIGFGTLLTKHQWESIHRNCQAFSMYDDYEDVRTNGGLIAYYFWEENNKGEIVSKNGKLFNQMKMPFKRNHYSYHQNVTSIFYKPMFTVLSFRINITHFIVLVAVTVLIFLLRRWLFRRIKHRAWWVRFGANLIVLGIFILLAFQSFFIVNRGYRLFEMTGGEITEMKGASLSQMRLEIARGIQPEVLAEDHLGSELFVKQKGKWMLKRRKNVLYFNQYTQDGMTYYKFVKDSDSLVLSTHSYSEKAESHYIVINYLDERRLKEQRVYNHLGVEITPKLSLPNPRKRILLFVNGYRPTSNGNSFEATFDSIMKKGLEHQNSINLIYDHDRYNYWEMWNEINKRFESKINPAETFYADGHFSVETSNHRSLVEFTSLSQTYPERCKNPKNHVCQDIEGEMTYKLFNLESNKEGFAERRENGRIAGRNLYQMLNEIPNRSKDDTLFIVAHSMGYAYSLGIIDELRGEINFGGFYILAPENAEAGNVKLSEWQEIWQYGSDFDENKFKSPCLLDGIAPQTKAGGLTINNRVFIPDDLYKRKGFFDSHFVGYYTWIFNLEKGDPGYIRQR